MTEHRGPGHAETWTKPDGTLGECWVVTAAEQQEWRDSHTVWPDQYKGIPRVVSVKVEQYPEKHELAGLWSVHPVWGGITPVLDRTDGAGWCVVRRRDVDRLRCALMAQVVHGPAIVMRDVNGHTYVQADSKVSAKYINADLRRLGY